MPRCLSIALSGSLSPSCLAQYRLSPSTRLDFVSGTNIVMVLRPFLSTLSPRSDLLTCVSGLKAERFLTVNSPSLAVDQKAEVRHAKTATSRGSTSEKCGRSFSICFTVIGSLLSFVDERGAMVLAPLTIESISGPPMFHATPCMMCHARTAET